MMAAPEVCGTAADDRAADLATTALAVARRLAAGGSLWWACPSADDPPPELPGVRELPSGKLLTALRDAGRAGDVVALLGTGGDAAEVLRRAPAWGVSTVWLGPDGSPEGAAADHVHRSEDRDGLLSRCRELLSGDRAALAPLPDCDGPVCITCSDEGRLAEVLTVAGPTAQVRTARGLEEADLTLVGTAQTHDLLVVHAGMALTRLERRTP